MVTILFKRGFRGTFSLPCWTDCVSQAKEDGCNADTVLHFVRSIIPDADLHSNIGTELSFTLPREASASFEEFFRELETQKGDLRVSSYGCAVTALEEVFLKVIKSAIRTARWVNPTLRVQNQNV